MQGVADLERDAIGQPAARRAAEAAAEIEHTCRWLDPGGFGQFGGRQNASGMKLVERSELSDSQHLVFGRDHCERRFDPASESCGAIVLTYLRGGGGHNFSP